MESELFWPVVLIVGGGFLLVLVLGAATRRGQANKGQCGWQPRQWQPPMSSNYSQNPFDGFIKFFACIGVGAVCLFCFWLGLIIAWNGW